MGADWRSQLSPASQPSSRVPSFLLSLHLLYIPPGKRCHQSLKKLCPSPLAIPTRAYVLGITAHLGSFLGSRSGGICLSAEHSSSICIKNQHSPDLPSCPAPPAWNSQAEQEHLLPLDQLTRPSPVAKTALNSDLWVVLACQRQPLEEVSSPSLRPQEWTVLPPVPS